jgi:hypothetical protein
MATVNSAYSPLDAPLPVLPEDTIFNELQWKTLLALCDVAIPAVTSQECGTTLHQKKIPAAEVDSAILSLTTRIEGPDAGRLARQYLEENASSVPLFKEAVRRTMAVTVPQQKRDALSLVLTTLK